MRKRQKIREHEKKQGKEKKRLQEILVINEIK